jgi:hypothetical protein
MAIGTFLLVVFNTVVDERLLEDRWKVMGESVRGSGLADNSQDVIELMVGHEEERKAKRVPGVRDHVDRAVGLAGFHLTDAGWLAASPTCNIIQTPASAAPGGSQLLAYSFASLIFRHNENTCFVFDISENNAYVKFRFYVTKKYIKIPLYRKLLNLGPRLASTDRKRTR